MRRYQSLAWLAGALLLGALITWVDTRPRWDDTGVTVGIILLTSATFGVARPRLAWLWALALGAGIPLAEVPLTHSAAPLVALAVAFFGASGGAILRTLLQRQTTV